MSVSMSSPPAAAWEPWQKARWPVLLSILGPVAWLSATLLYVGFWAEGFSLFQSVVVVLVSLIVLAGVMGAAWWGWGVRHAGAKA